MNENDHGIRKFFNFLNQKFYEEITLLIFDLFNITTILIIIYSYQKYDKGTEIGAHFYYSLFLMYFFSFLSWGLSLVAKVKTKSDSLTVHTWLNSNNYNQSPSMTKLDYIFSYLIPSLQAIIMIILFYPISISGYSKTFSFFKYLYILCSCIKTILCFYTFEFVVEIIKLFLDPYLIAHMLLLTFSDPVVNSEDYPNIVNTNETELRCGEFWIIMIAYKLLMGYNDINKDRENKIFSFSAIIGPYDSVRYFSFLITVCFYFPIVNGLAYSYRYFFSLFNIPLAFFMINCFMKKQIFKAQILTMVFFFINFGIYLWAFFNSYPNEGIGGGDIYNIRNDTNITNGSVAQK